MSLIEGLQKHVNNDNIYYIEELANIIIEEKINSIEELKEYENKYNKINGEIPSLEDMAKRWINLIDTYPYEHDGLLLSQIKKLQEERKLINDSLLENKILHIIKYHYLTNRDNPFPYQTYQLIIQDKL